MDNGCERVHLTCGNESLVIDWRITCGVAALEVFSGLDSHSAHGCGRSM